MKICRLLLLLTLLAHLSGAQETLNNELNPDVEWGDGSVMLNDGTELKGVVRYNDRNGLVSFQNGDDSRSFTARSIMGFEFFDEALKRQRLFYTLPFQNQDEQGKRPTIFEVLKDLQNFAIISKMDPVEIEVRQSGAFGAASGGVAVVVGGGMQTFANQTETVFFLTPEGEIRPYMKVIRKVADRLLYDRSKIKHKLIDDDLIEEFIPKEKYEQLRVYAKKNDLEFGIKEDLIKIFEYYKTL
jgi:hypothetical protein